MDLDDPQQPRTSPAGLVPRVMVLDPAATVPGALELLPRPDLDPFERLARAFLAEYPPNSARAYRSDLHAWAG